MDGDGGSADAGFVGVAFIFFFKLVFLFGQNATGVAKSFDAVRGELGFNNSGVTGFFESFGVIVGVHHVEILSAREDDCFFIRRNGRPHWFLAQGLDVIEARDFGAGDIVFEGKDASFFARFRWLARTLCVLALLAALFVFVLFHFTFVALLAAIVLSFFLGLIGNDAVFANFHFEAHVGVFVDEPQPFDREMLSVIRKIGESGKRGRDFGVIPE